MNWVQGRGRGFRRAKVGVGVSVQICGGDEGVFSPMMSYPVVEVQGRPIKRHWERVRSDKEGGSKTYLELWSMGRRRAGELGQRRIDGVEQSFQI